MSPEDAYLSIAEELANPEMTLDDFAPDAIEAAHSYAITEAAPWPPRI